MDALNNRFITPSFTSDDVVGEVTLRPQRLPDYIGQERTKEKLNIVIAFLVLAIIWTIVIFFIGEKVDFYVIAYAIELADTSLIQVYQRIQPLSLPDIDRMGRM